MYWLHLWMCTACVPSAIRGHKRVPDPLELELRTVVSCRVGAVNQTQVFCKNSMCS